MASPPCLLCHEASSELEYYKFPITREMRAAWTSALGGVYDTVCSGHFTAEDYCLLRGRRRLRPSAVPRLPRQKSPPTSNETVKETSSEQKEDVSIPIPSEKTSENKETKNTKSKKNQSKKTKKGAKKKVTETPTVEDKEVTKDISDKKDPSDAKKDASDDKKEEICVKENGTASTESAKPEEKDIEDMITNYQIKQTRTLADRLNPEPLEGLIPTVASQSSINQQDKQLPLDREAVAKLASRLDSQLASTLANKLGEASGAPVVDLVPELTVGVDAAPVFIEVSVDKEPGSRAASPQDCMMLLESVQCEVDPSSLMLPEADSDSDMEIVDTNTKSDNRKENADPISLLTSSDEDEVIIQEPHIDTVDVSDETDEDDRPLTRFVQPKQEPKKPAWFDNLTSMMPKLQYHWGVYQYSCEQCNFRTQSETEFKQHILEFEHHSIPVQVCPTCNYSTGSKAQFARHRRKHKDERNYKCHLCNYKARHNMSLMYHLKSHQPRDERNPIFVCDKCGFSSNLKSEGLSHIKTCVDNNSLRCDQCNYTTKRKSDFKRHRMRKHSIDDTDTDFIA